MARCNVARLGDAALAQSLLRAGETIAAKFQKFMLVRTVMSVLTGAMIFCSDLIRHIPIAMRIGLITVSSYPGASVSAQQAHVLRERV